MLKEIKKINDYVRAQKISFRTFFNLAFDSVREVEKPILSDRLLRGNNLRNRELKLTASVWMGWAANKSPASVANGAFSPAMVRETLVNNMQAVA